MTCPGEYSCALYADGELEGSEGEALAAHLDACARCRSLVAAFRAESQLLTRSLRDLDWMAEPGRVPSAARTGLVIGRWAAGIAGLAALLRFGWASIWSGGLPGAVEWLDPFSLEGRLNWLTVGLSYLIVDGGSMILSYLNALSLMVFNLLVLSALVYAASRLRPARAVLTLGALLLAVALPSHAIDVRNPRVNGGSGAIVVSSGETVDDTLVVFGESVRVDGTVTGDLIAFVQRVEIEGTVDGNVISFAQNVEVRGNVGGDVLGFAQTFRVSGEVGQNLLGFAQTIELPDAGRVLGNALVGGAFTNVNGRIERDLIALGASADIAGSVGGNLDFRGGRLTVRSPARIDGDLVARVQEEDNVQIDPGAAIAGERSVERTEPGPSRYRTAGFYIGQVIRIAAAFVSGMLLFWLFPSLGTVRLDSGGHILTAGGVGFLVLVTVPVAAIIAAITLVGLPVAVIGVVLWLLGLYLSKIMVAQFLGRKLMGGGGSGAAALGLLAGIFVIVIAVNLPFVGGILNFLLILIGFGALLTAVYEASRWSGLDRAVPPPAP